MLIHRRLGGCFYRSGKFGQDDRQADKTTGGSQTQGFTGLPIFGSQSQTLFNSLSQHQPILGSQPPFRTSKPSVHLSSQAPSNSNHARGAQGVVPKQTYRGVKIGLEGFKSNSHNEPPNRSAPFDSLNVGLRGGDSPHGLYHVQEELRSHISRTMDDIQRTINEQFAKVLNGLTTSEPYSKSSSNSFDDLHQMIHNLETHLEVIATEIRGLSAATLQPQSHPVPSSTIDTGTQTDVQVVCMTTTDTPPPEAAVPLRGPTKDDQKKDLLGHVVLAAPADWNNTFKAFQSFLAFFQASAPITQGQTIPSVPHPSLPPAPAPAPAPAPLPPTRDESGQVAVMALESGLLDLAPSALPEPSGADLIRNSGRQTERKRKGRVPDVPRSLKKVLSVDLDRSQEKGPTIVAAMSQGLTNDPDTIFGGVLDLGEFDGEGLQSKKEMRKRMKEHRRKTMLLS